VPTEGLRSLLDAAHDFALAGAESALPDALQPVRQLQPSVFLLDKAFGVHAVRDCLRTLREQGGKGESVTEGETFRFLQSALPP